MIITVDRANVLQARNDTFNLMEIVTSFFLRTRFCREAHT